MRSRSSTPPSSDLSSDFSVLSPPTDPVDPLTAAMENVDLDDSATSGDNSFEFVVMPMSPASEQSEESLFSVLSIPSTADSLGESDSGSDSGSDADDSLSVTSSGRSRGSVPALGRSAEEGARPTEQAHPSRLPTSANTSSESQSARLSSPPSLHGAQSAPRDYKEPSTGAPTSTVASESIVAEVTTSLARLSVGQRHRRRKAAVKAAAFTVQSGGRSIAEASVGFSKVHKACLNRIIQEASQKTSTHASAHGNEIVHTSASSRKQKREDHSEAVVDAAVKTVLAGLQTPEQAAAGFTEAQKLKLDSALRNAMGLPLSAETVCPVTIESSASLSKQQRKNRRKAAVTAAIRAVVAGIPESQATAGFTEAQRLRFDRNVKQVSSSATPAEATTLLGIHCKKLNRSDRRSGGSSGSDSGDTESESGYSTATATTMSAREAASSINADTESYTSRQENKLALWQALCIEFGLVEVEDLADLPTERTHRSTAPSPPSVSTSSSSDSSRSSSPSRCTTPTPGNPFPSSLTQAKALLSTVNVPLRKYMKLRKANPNPKPGEYAYLLEPDFRTLRRRLVNQHQFVNLDDVKAEWLNPLLKDFGFHRRRARST